MLLKVSKTMFYTDYFLVEVPGLTDRAEINESTLYEFIKEQEPEPYYTSEEPVSGDVEWHEVDSSTAADIEARSHMKRHTLVLEQGENEEPQEGEN